MDYIPANNVVQAELIFLWSNETVENVLHFQVAGSPDVDNMTALAAYLVTWWTTNMKPLMPANLFLSSIKVTDLTTSTGPSFVYGTGLPINGVNVSPSLPNNCAIVLTKRTAYRGRSNRGRIYMPGLIEAQVVDNVVAAGYLGFYLNLHSLLLSFTAGGVDWTMVVVSKKSGGNWRVAATVTEVVSLTSDGIIDSQRRRLPKRGQ